MTATLDIANQLVALNRAGKFEEALDTLFSPDAVSIEAGAPPGQSPESRGLDAIRAKSQWWTENHEIHDVEITGPWPNGDRFIVGFKMDVTNKPSGKRFTMGEAGLYTIENGKIVKEEFFYALGT